MDVESCRICKRLFDYLGGQKICPECRDALEKKFIEVRDYIRANPNVDITQIAEDNEVSVQQLNEWVREGRLEFTKGSPIKINCEKCGASITSGRFCDKCKEQMAGNLSSAFKKDESASKKKSIDPKGEKMRFYREN